MSRNRYCLTACAVLVTACAVSRRPPQPPKQGCGTAVQCYADAIVILEDARKTWEAERQNLKQQVRAAIPIGTVIAYAAEDLPPEGWLPCDGNEYPVASYPKLAALLAARYGKAVRPGQFKVPDYRGYFLRGWDPEKLRDPGDNRTPAPDAAVGSWGVGTRQSDLVGNHVHPVPLPFEAQPTGSSTVGYVNFNVQGRTPRYTTSDGNGGAETRPKNVSVVFLIRAD